MSLLEPKSNSLQLQEGERKLSCSKLPFSDVKAFLGKYSLGMTFLKLLLMLEVIYLGLNLE